jgi:sarcosine oxidase subunit beta
MSARLDTDVAIVGGGIAGCAAAVALRKRGVGVVLLDKGRCGAAASGVNFGGVRQQGRHFGELPLTARARALWMDMNALLGEDVEFVESGHIKLARSDADLDELERYAAGARDHGLDLTMMGANAVRAELPWLGEAVFGASLSPTDGHANPRVVGPAYARLARRMGADIRENAPVQHVQWTGSAFELSGPGLTVRARKLLNAAGAGAGAIAAAFGEATPLAPLYPNMVVTEPMRFFIPRAIGVCGGDVYARQISRGNVIFGGGGGWGDAELGIARPLAEETMAGVKRTLSLIPGLAEASVIRTWTGLDGVLPDRLPVIGPSLKVPGLVHAFGFSGHGFQPAPAVGEIACELLEDGRTPTPLDIFSIARFAQA